MAISAAYCTYCLRDNIHPSFIVGYYEALHVQDALVDEVYDMKIYLNGIVVTLKEAFNKNENADNS